MYICTDLVYVCMYVQTDSIQSHDISVQADFSVHVDTADDEKLPRGQLDVSMIELNDKATNFYTGLPAWSAVYFHLFMFLSPFVTKVCTTMTMDNQILLTLTRLRLNLLYEDLAGRYAEVLEQFQTFSNLG